MADVSRGGVFPLGAGIGRMVGRIPVVDGPQNEPPKAEVAGKLGACSACGYGDRNGVIRTRIVVDCVWLVLCVDWQACTERYRAGVTAVTYAAGLRGEILAVAP